MAMMQAPSRKPTAETAAERAQCSDCWLGGLALQLASPFGYDDVLASNFASLTYSCNVTAYTYATPTQYAVNATATTTP
ncbi:hypothetical protein N7510_009464 [Penicillium lagena]|uniref:uncharacterized protein n=1 Tax=Penicillium lagena TaxID=94218 RepID=UPI0025410B16|nr:uncharacterized protein N7510_009464 [Penicillium lagena]KAJ5606683.1 hypothetical protein N7510_009464 [Penicillium lagena]